MNSHITLLPLLLLCFPLWAQSACVSRVPVTVPCLLYPSSTFPPREARCLPQCYTILVHCFLILIDSYKEISQDPMQNTVTLISQCIPQQSNSIFIFLFSAWKEKDRSSTISSLSPPFLLGYIQKAQLIKLTFKLVKHKIHNQYVIYTGNTSYSSISYFNILSFF